MTTSCEALKNAMTMALTASSRSPMPGSCRDIAAMATSSAIWVMSSHPLRRPRNGGTYRSMTGAQSHFREYGSPTRLKRPMVVRSMFSTRIQA